MQLVVDSSFLLLLFLSVSDATVGRRNNVCHTWSGYWDGNIANNPDCFYNPDISMDVPEFLEKYFGEYETYEIPTKDGYFVTTFRIPKADPKGIILFRHPAVSDSISWVGLGNESMAFFFWKRGYEIWMTNSRGTRFSTKHVNLTINDYAFWDFSFHEIGLYDLRASLKYIYRKSNQRKIIVIGHSMGSTESLIYASMFPEEAKKLSHVFILMGPTSSLKYIKGRIFAQLIPFLQEYAEKERLGVAFWKSSTMADIVHNMCPHIPDFCITVFNFVGAGWAEEEENPPAAALILTQHPRAMSYKSIFHYGQFVSSGKFQMFDYGQKNMETYGKLEPPEYPIEQIKVPIFLVYSPSDNFAPEEDIDNLYQRLPGISKIYGKLRIEKMNHIDIIMGKHRKEKIYYKIEDLLNEL